MTKRIEYIDAMRGFIMLLVVMHHIGYGCMGLSNFIWHEFVPTFCMPLFFFISGWAFYNIDRVWTVSSAKGALRNKLTTLIVPTCLFLFLYLYITEALDFRSLGNDKMGYWFTFVLFEFFCIYILAEYFLNKKNQKKNEFYVGLAAVTLSILSFCYAKYYVQYTEELGRWKIILGFLCFTKFKHFLFFWLGTLTKRYYSDFIKFTNNRYVILGGVLLFLMMIVETPHVDYVYGEYLLYVLLALAEICVAFTFFRVHEIHFSQVKVLGRIFQFVGRRTLDIYLLHYFFLPYNLEFIGSFLKKGDNRIIDMLFILPLSIWIIAICLIVSEIIRLSPLLAHYLFGLKNNSIDKK